MRRFKRICAEIILGILGLLIHDLVFGSIIVLSFSGLILIGIGEMNERY